MMTQTEHEHSDQRMTTLPFVWPAVTELTGQARNGARAVPFDHALEDMESLLGIVSAVDGRGATWLETFLKQRSDLKALVVLAVYAGCPTRAGDLARLLDLQTQAAGKIKVRILPMANGDGAPANCLVAVPADNSAPVFLFGPTPNFSIDGCDRTQVNMAFRAEMALFNRWRCWFDGAWLQAVPLAETTADIPALAPAAGSSEAAAQWNAYCTLCAKSAQSASIIVVDPETEEVQSGKKQDGLEDPTPSSILKLSKLDPLADRVARLSGEGRQVTIDYSSRVQPLHAPVDPRLLGQEAKRRDGTVVQRQSFRISVFSEEELKKINEYRKGTQAIIKKLGLPLEIGLYWLPNAVISIFEKEINAKNEEAKQELNKLVEGNAKSFVKGKIEKIQDDFTNVYQRLVGEGDVPQHTLTGLVDALTLRINRALDAQLLTPVTFSEVRFDLREKEGWQAPWAQAEKLVIALARFPRQAIHRSKTLAGLQTSQSEILTAMDVEDDVILKVEKENRLRSERRARSELQTLEQIANADILGRDRCEVGFMLIDGKPLKDIHQFIANRESAQ